MVDRDGNQPAQQFVLRPVSSEEGTDQSTMPGHIELDWVMEWALEIIFMIRSRWWLLIPLPLLFIGAAHMRITKAAPTYRATCQLLVEPNPALNVTVGGSLYDPMRGSSFQQFINTQISLMKTQEFLSQAFEAMSEQEREQYAVTADAVGRLRGALDIKPVDRTYLIDVTYHSRDPKEAARIANFLGELYVKGYRQRKQGASNTGIEILKQQIEEIARAKDEAQKALQEFHNRNGIIDLSQEREWVLSRIEQLSTVVLDAELDITELQERRRTLKEWYDQGDFDVVVQSLDNGFVSSCRIQLLREEAEMPTILSKYDETHDTVKTKRRIMANIRKAMEQEIMVDFRRLELEEKRAEHKSGALQKKNGDLHAKLGELEQLSGEYTILRDSYDTAKQVYQQLLGKLNAAKIDASVEDISSDAVAFLSVAQRAVPGSRIVTDVRSAFIKAGILGLVFGAGLCVLFGLLDAAVKRTEEIESIMHNVPVLGGVPIREKDASELIGLKEPLGAVSEAFRNIRTSLALSLVGRRETCFAVSSSTPKEGKTTVSFNLALALARAGKRVLLLECDMRRPRLKHFLGDAAPDRQAPGLSRVLVGDAQLSDVVIPLQGLENLSIALCGTVPPNPAELLGGDAFDALLAEAKETYDAIVIDAPPVLSVADASILAGRGIPIIFVVRLMRTNRRELRACVDRLRTIGATVAGIVVNHADEGRRGYYRYGRGYYRGKYGYGYGYGYGYAHEGGAEDDGDETS